MKEKEQDSLAKFNRVGKPFDILFSCIFIFLGLLCVLPVFFVVMISFTSEATLAEYGYQFFPKELSIEAYQFLWQSKNMLIAALIASVVVTVVGTVIGVFLTTTMGYVLSRPGYKLKGFLTWVVFIPMIFNGGLISSYFVNSSVLNLRDSTWVLILPLAVSSFNVIICKTFFRTTVPDSIIESAKIDGATQLRIYFGIVLPISLPVLATIGLFLTFTYWNDWFNALLYLSTKSKFTLQALLMQIDKNIEYMTQNAATLGMTQAAVAASIPKESFRMSMAVIIILPIACAYPFFQKYFISGLTIGAVKG